MDNVSSSEGVSDSLNVKQKHQGEDGDTLKNTTSPQTESPEESPTDYSPDEKEVVTERADTSSSTALEPPDGEIIKHDEDMQISTTTSETAPPEENLSENKKGEQGSQNENTGTLSQELVATMPPAGEAHEVDGQGNASSFSLENISDDVENKNVGPLGARQPDSVSTREKTTRKVNQSESKDSVAAEGENEHEDSSSCEDTSRSKDKDREKKITSPQTASPKKKTREKKKSEIENIGPVPDETTKSLLPFGGCLVCLLVVVVAVGAAVLLRSPPSESPRQENIVDVFLRRMDKVRTQFPNQRAELWKRSTIHLQRHLQMAQPTEPVSLILTAGSRAETTLHCLARGLASAFSSALNASVLHINGTNQAHRDSDQVKLDIDRKLQGAFEGDKPVAVIHRFEELPPGSTLIFYRYCDHENAAYKETFLIFTVLLGENEDIPAKIHLSAVEEMVDDHLQKKFLSRGHPVSFDRMDVDKYGGLWSRISHLILPVAAEERIETKGCHNT